MGYLGADPMKRDEDPPRSPGVPDGAGEQLAEHDLPDEVLMDRYCAGDTVAYEVLFRRYTPRLVRFLTNMVGPAQAVDMAQVTFLKVHQNRHRYRSGSSVPAWLFTIARNTALDHLRSAPRRREVFGVEKEEADDRPSRDMLKDERIRAAIDKLPESQREVILLHWYSGLTFEEVGRSVGATGAAVRVRAHRAYQKLRGTLKSLYEEGK
jgi:RNA polymerase sigma-70 factor (ECF subfamily)